MQLAEDREIFNLHADFCKVIAHPTRLMIIATLGDGELTVGQIVEAIGVPLANISQHLRILRDRNLVHARKEGRSVFYRLQDSRLVGVCQMIRSILLDGLQKRGELARRAGSQSLSGKTKVQSGKKASSGQAAGDAGGSNGTSG